ncbi:UNKNOWN [Stylonychia lemnae]|uniref:Uncharacterized protein n=1 Tax=Stylonychia lemnae TaxID=5949 RepID=A0A078A3S5_STYLE|nr:UNKNOWN [Stylonychia lemnae]|eukprot:CDW75404.1 UNKNOWN [Stylonychia lemnae]
MIRPTNSDLNQCRVSLLSKHGQKYEKLLSSVILSFMNSNQAFTVDDIERKFIVKLSSTSQGSSEKLPSAYSNSINFKNMSPNKGEQIQKPDRNGMMTTVLTPRKNEDMYNQGSIERNQNNSISKGDNRNINSSQYLKNKRYTLQLSPLEAQQRAASKTNQSHSINLRASAGSNNEHYSRTFAKSHTRDHNNHDAKLQNLALSPQNDYSLMSGNGNDYSPFLNKAKLYQNVQNKNSTIDKLNNTITFENNLHNQFMKTHATFKSSAQNPLNKIQFFNNSQMYDNLYDISPNNKTPGGSNPMNSTAQSSFYLTKRKKNYTMWDIITLQDSYKAKIDENFEKQQKRDHLQQLAHFNKLQQQSKQNQMETTISYQKRQEQKELKKYMDTNNAIEEMYRLQRLQNLQQVQKDNLQKHHLRTSKNNLELLQNNLTEQQTQENAEMMFEQNKLREQQRIQFKKMQMRQELLTDIKEKKNSKKNFEKLDKTEEIVSLQEVKKQMDQRDQNLRDHLNKIQQRDDLLQKYYQKPQIKTHSQNEYLKTKEIDDIIKKQEAEVKRQEQERERAKAQRKRQMIQEMVTTNKIFENQSVNSTMNRTFMRQTTSDLESQNAAIMMNEHQIAFNKRNNDLMNKTSLRDELQRQMIEKEQRRIQEKLTVEDKQFATSKKLLMRSISPDLMGSKGFDQLENEDQRVAEEIDRLNRLLK